MVHSDELSERRDSSLSVSLRLAVPLSFSRGNDLVTASSGAEGT
jgi:hypothetical protein